MSCYELVLAMRQDLSFSEVDNIMSQLSNFVTENDGEVVKTEYWGLKSLAYIIANNKKAHYALIGISLKPNHIAGIKHLFKINESIIRHTIVKVDKISKDPSPVLQNVSQRFEESVSNENSTQ
ncbi:MAG: 30S ribosomal protein S6 [Rickettsiaceae bacterium]